MTWKNRVYRRANGSKPAEQITVLPSAVRKWDFTGRQVTRWHAHSAWCHCAL